MSAPQPRELATRVETLEAFSPIVTSSLRPRGGRRVQRPSLTARRAARRPRYGRCSDRTLGRSRFGPPGGQSRAWGGAAARSPGGTRLRGVLLIPAPVRRATDGRTLNQDFGLKLL